MVSRCLWRAALVALVAVLSACNPFSPLGREKDELEAARRVWRNQGLTSYEFRVEHGCFCVARGAALVRVQDGRPVSVTYVETGAPVTPDPFLPLTVEGLFDVIGDAIEEEADRVDVSYDSALGYPLTIAIDFDPRIADEEQYYQASNLRPLR